MTKVALLIGVSEYAAGLEALPAAVRDVAVLKRALQNPQIGGFDDVRELLNPEPQQMQEAIELIFGDRAKDDLILLFFSGHGVKDDQSRLYFATPRTRKTERGDLIKSTAVSAREIHEHMSSSRAKRQVVILDCCYSGAFATDMPAKAAKTEDISADIRSQLGSEGRIVLTSSTATQYSFGQPNEELSVYTRYLVEGLTTGAADLDGDGEISVDELHEHTRRNVQEAAPAMKPEMYVVREGYRIKLARAPVGDPRLIYRKEVEELVRSSHGEISYLDRPILNAKRSDLNLPTEAAERIEAEVLKPYQERQQKLRTYEQAWQEVIQREAEISEVTRTKLKRLQQTLNLRDEDVARIEAASPFRRRRVRPASVSQPPRTSPTSPVVSRQQFLKWAGFGGGGLIVAVVGNQILQSQQTAEKPKVTASVQPSEKPQAPQQSTKATARVQPSEKPAAPLSLTAEPSVGFETVTVDAKGQEIKRDSRQAKLIKQDLGSGIALELVAIPAGEFSMGTADADRDTLIREYTRHGVKQEDAQKWIAWEMPQRRVKIPEFWMGRFAVTQAQWKQVAQLPKINLDLNPDPANFKGAKRPIEQVSWDEAVEFCARLSRKTEQVYRLPSEAEWEYACRSGTTTPFHFGPTITADLVNCNGNYPYGDAPKGKYRAETTEVGVFLPNSFGLYDMHGNVWEWCQDVWHASYENAPMKEKSLEEGGDRDLRLLRGGSWFDNPGDCRSAHRNRFGRDIRDYDIGFRVVCAAPRIL